MSQKAESDAVRAAFGANQWLVDELYEQYLTDKSAVDPAWWDFFEDYRPRGEGGATSEGDAPTSDEPAATRSGSNGPASTPAGDGAPAARTSAGPSADGARGTG
ncbi:hypothetical protein ICW40_11635, partial [Actinotalea ferrariae]|uniref:2-oxoglutarate dehydrogenase E1 subunit family protein n=1 Tax=Actinotalea ferrariae TaxID=1386098 RepID=UPI001C8C4ADC